MVNVLALPVYHREMMEYSRPPPWSAIGVVTISSSSYGSIVGMKDDQRTYLRAVAQTQTAAILEKVLR